MATASCPFCASEVQPDLVAYGGTCPKCLAEIPGDEAPTDPGLEVRKKQERSDRMRARIPMVLAFVLLMGLVSCTGATALAVVLWPKPEVAELLDFDTMDFPMPEVVSVGVVPPEAPDPTPGTKPKPGKSPHPDPQPKPTRPTPDRPAVEPAAPGQPDASTPTDPTRPRVTPNGTGISLSGPKVRRDDNRVITDPEEIRLMIGERMRDNIPTLQACYERRLKVEESLAGRWALNFTVSKTGDATGVSVKGLDRQDVELETCIVNLVTERWRFSKINVDQPVKKTVKFSQ